MKKLRIISIALPAIAILFSLLMLLAMVGGGVGSGAAGIPKYADDEKILEYCEYASSFGVNYVLVSLADAYESYEEYGTVDLSGKNPMDTTLAFLCLDIDYWTKTIETDLETGDIVDERTEFSHSERYLGEEILDFAGIGSLDLSPDRLRQSISEKCEEREVTGNDGTTATKHTFYTVWNIRQNPDTLVILTGLGLPEDIADVFDEISRMGSMQLLVEEDTWLQILDILGKYALYQDMDYDPENADVVGRMPGRSHGNFSGTVLSGGSGPDVQYLAQADERWYDILYGKSSTIGAAGCGPTSMAMVVNALAGAGVNPVDMSEWSVRNGHRAEGNGSFWSIVPGACMAWGIPCVDIGRDGARLRTALHDPTKLVVAIMGKGHFTSAGHFIVLRGFGDDGKVLVADPASINRSQMGWDISIILSEAKNLWVCG